LDKISVRSFPDCFC